MLVKSQSPSTSICLEPMIEFCNDKDKVGDCLQTMSLLPRRLGCESLKTTAGKKKDVQVRAVQNRVEVRRIGNFRWKRRPARRTLQGATTMAT
mmetsp:Transcript_17885/g.26554  ORF Transcript_17885/g.26554 Transcript_17885/m.26554 type:complete len:93 (-) Transcript_17885:116-394(-)